jgi:uncharacterized membrane protein
MSIHNIPASKVSSDDDIFIRQVTPHIIPDWLHAGVTDIHLGGRASLFYGIIFAAVGVIIHSIFAENYWLLAGTTTGFFLLGPFLAMGLYDLSRRMGAGEEPTLTPTLTAWLPNLINISLFTMLLILVFFAWIRLSMSIFAHYFNGALPTFADVVINVFTFKQPTFLFVYFSAGAIFATFIFSISVIAMPLMLDRNASAWIAAITSLRTCARNPVTMALWAFCIVVLVGFGLATNFLGLILTMPVVGHASWHVYRDLIEIKD